jgi:hypothetical protein
LVPRGSSGKSGRGGGSLSCSNRAQDESPIKTPNQSNQVILLKRQAARAEVTAPFRARTGFPGAWRILDDLTHIRHRSGTDLGQHANVMGEFGGEFKVQSSQSTVHSPQSKVGFGFCVLSFGFSTGIPPARAGIGWQRVEGRGSRVDGGGTLAIPGNGFSFPAGTVRICRKLLRDRVEGK